MKVELVIGAAQHIFAEIMHEEACTFTTGKCIFNAKNKCAYRIFIIPLFYPKIKTRRKRQSFPEVPCRKLL